MNNYIDPDEKDIDYDYWNEDPNDIDWQDLPEGDDDPARNHD